MELSSGMTTEVVPSRRPEEAELERKRATLASLEAKLAQRELDLHTLRAELLAFEARYLRAVSAHYAELDELRAQIAEAQAAGKPEDPDAREQAAGARAKAQESAQTAHDASREPERPPKFQPSEELRRLYREVARQVHPDLATDEEDRARRTRLMAEVNRAYEEGDEARLQAVIEEWESRPEAVTGEDVPAQLVRVIRKIAQVESRLHQIDTDMAQVQESDLCRLKAKADEAERKGGDLIAEMVEALESQIAAARDQLAAIKAGRSGAWATR